MALVAAPARLLIGTQVVHTSVVVDTEQEQVLFVLVTATMLTLPEHLWPEITAANDEETE